MRQPRYGPCMHDRTLLVHAINLGCLILRPEAPHGQQTARFGWVAVHFANPANVLVCACMQVTYPQFVHAVSMCLVLRAATDGEKRGLCKEVCP